jgi:diguanylate cyclase
MPAISTFQLSADHDFDAVPGELTPEVVAQRVLRRRVMLKMTAASCLIDVALLLLYALAGTIQPAIAVAYGACGVACIAVIWALSETGITDRFKDHDLVLPQAAASVLQLVVFTCLAPQVGIQFLCTLFIVISFSTLRTTLRQNILVWTLMAVGLAAMFLLTDRPIALPHTSYLERATTMLVLLLTTGRCMFLGMFANSQRMSLYARGVELVAANRRIEELAELDELTGSFNRRCIMRLLDDEIVGAQRDQSACSVALIDLDWFKRINDAYGHPTGDEVLRTFAITMFANIRAIDKFGRYGGEEFLLVLPGIPHAAAVQIVDRLRAILAGLDWSAFSDALAVTISAGVATLTTGETPDALLARADGALYAAKAQGRNRVASG